MKIILLVLLLLPALLMLSIFSPRFFIDNGVEDFGSANEELASQALLQSDMFFNGEPTALIVSAKRVSSVKRCPDTPSRPRPFMFPVSAEVQLYTAFGVPFTKLKVQCGSMELTNRSLE